MALRCINGIDGSNVIVLFVRPDCRRPVDSAEVLGREGGVGNPRRYGDMDIDNDDGSDDFEPPLDDETRMRCGWMSTCSWGGLEVGWLAMNG